jgi:hypothetical protein
MHTAPASLDHPLQEARGRLDGRHRLEDDRRDRVGRERPREGLQVAVVERARERARRRGHAQVAARRPDRPVLPAVVAAHHDVVAAGVRARQTDRRRGRVAAVLAETHALGAGHALDQRLRDLGLQRVRQAERHAALELLAHGGVDVGVAVAERDGREAVHEVDVLVAVDVPHARARAVREVERRRAARQRGRALAERLRAERNAAQRALELRQAALVRARHEGSSASERA